MPWRFFDPSIPEVDASSGSISLLPSLVTVGGDWDCESAEESQCDDSSSLFHDPCLRDSSHISPSWGTDFP